MGCGDGLKRQGYGKLGPVAVNLTGLRPSSPQIARLCFFVRGADC